MDLGSVEEEGSPLVNRGFSAYAPGSVFKLVTAAALLEEGMGDTVFTCVGSSMPGGCSSTASTTPPMESWT